MPTEQAFLAANPLHDPMFVCRQLPGIRAMSLAVGSEREIVVALLSGSIAAVTVVSLHYEQWLRRRYPELVSPHGGLGATLGLHMVVLLLDPFFDAAGQPLRIGDDEFVSCFGGHAFVTSPS